jgi:excisionase family DNA binding protein
MRLNTEEARMTNHEAHDEQEAPPTTGEEGGGFEPFEPLLDTEEAAALLRIHPKTLQKMARNRDITGIQIGRLWRFRASALDRWLRKTASK